MSVALAYADLCRSINLHKYMHVCNMFACVKCISHIRGVIALNASNLSIELLSYLLCFAVWECSTPYTMLMHMYTLPICWYNCEKRMQSLTGLKDPSAHIFAC